MANTLATPDLVLREVAYRFNTQIQFLRNVTRTYDDQYRMRGAKVGYTVKARRPQRFTVTHGSAFQPQNLYDETVPITLSDQMNTGFGYTSAEATCELDDIKGRYVDPAGDVLAAEADKSAFANLWGDVYNSIGTPGTTPSTALQLLQAGQKLTDLGAPMDGRVAVMDGLAQLTISNTASTLFNPSGKISQNWETGQLAANQLGIGKYFVDSQRPIHTTGTFTACSPTVNGANQTGSSIITQSWASGATTLNKNEVVTFAGCYSVHPISKQSTGRLQQFTVTAQVSDSTGDMTISISPSIITSGPLQTVSGSPADNAAVTVWSIAAGAAMTATVSPVSLIYHPDAFTVAFADLEKPGGNAKVTMVRAPKAGFAIRMWEDSDQMTDTSATRLDILDGSASIQPAWACRLVG
jgi:hypothetical protein